MPVASSHPLHYSIHSRLRLARLQRLLPETTGGGRLLDVGCGLGYLSEMLGRGYQCVGVDYDMASLEANQKREIGRMVRGRVDRLAFRDASFDLIVCSEVLEHLPQGLDAAVMKEMARVLKPGGRILITVPALEGIRATSRLRNLGHDDPNGGEYHFRMGYSKEELEALFMTLPLEVHYHGFSMVIFSELAMDLLKWVYFKKNALKEHADIMGVQSSLLFRLYRTLFPLLHFFFVVEDILLASWINGHIHILCLTSYLPTEFAGNRVGVECKKE
ncbi:MAG: class I SAM-dependent methyltransferase [Magnetococcales bacterium]|nr:class I SAM-dependent methyltransferase [Magnetococcales bacterium]